MDQAERKENFGTCLRRAWNAAVQTAEAMERSPVEELFDRIGRLEWEVAALKKEGATGIHAAIGEIADAERA
jgi:polyhydroxyalkanoate synthesis regulator phasin